MIIARTPRVPPLALAAVLVGCFLTACGQIPPTMIEPSSPASGAPTSSTPAPSPSASPPAAPGPAGAGGEQCEYVPSGTAARPVDPPSATGVPTSGTVRYVLAMTGGNVTVTLDRVKAPCTAHAFESLAAQGFYDQTRCHRLADSTIFILQCGDPTATGRGGPGYSFPDETDGTESYVRGVVAMANGGPNTNGSQFFLVWDDSTRLPARYTIFGSMDEASHAVVAGMAFEGQDGRFGSQGGRPNNPSAILSVKRR